MTMANLSIEYRSISHLRPYPRNARTHTKKQIKQIADSIRHFGFTNPVLISDDNEIIAGHGRVKAAKLLGMDMVPTVTLSHLSGTERRAYVLADNKLALDAGWDQEILAIELQALIDLDVDIELTGFSVTETDIVLDIARESDPAAVTRPEDKIPPLRETVVTCRGDVWQLGRHRLLCGDARDAEEYKTLVGDERADLVFTDPPYNVPIDGHVCGLGRIRHPDFAMGVGEMSDEAYTAFLLDSLGKMASVCRDGAIAFVCMDWRHIEPLLTASKDVFAELKNLCVWNKSNGGMGTFYRSKHELIFVFKVGTARHVNNFGLGDTGRYRTNVWDYPGISSLSGHRAEELAMHPTVKPVALVADAIKDCSKRGDLILDAFGGSGTTLIAAQKTGRLARLIDCDPHYCDTIIRRFEILTGKRARLTRTNESFEDVAEARLRDGEAVS